MLNSVPLQAGTISIAIVGILLSAILAVVLFILNITYNNSGRLSTIEEKFNQFGGKIEDIQQDISSIESDISDIRTRVVRLESDLDGIEEHQISQFDERLEDISRRLREVEGPVVMESVINRDMIDFNEEISQLMNQVDQLEESIEKDRSIQSQLATISNKIDRIENRLNEMEGRTSQDNINSSSSEDQSDSGSIRTERHSSADLIVKAAVKERMEDKNIASDFYEDLNSEVAELIHNAADRAKTNDRKTVQPRDL